MSETQPGSSPRWGWTTKLIVGLTLVAIIGWLLVKFQNFLGPLLLVFILAYILYPLAKRLSSGLKIPWRLAVSLIYLVVLIVLIGLVTLGGLALVNQLQSLINFLQQALVSLPTFIQNLTQQVFRIGPFQFALAQIDINAVSNQILSAVQPLLGKVGGILGIVATSAAGLVGWIVFILLVSYFILVESHGFPTGMFRIHVPGFDADIKRLGAELNRVWNSFLHRPDHHYRNGLFHLQHPAQRLRAALCPGAGRHGGYLKIYSLCRFIGDVDDLWPGYLLPDCSPARAASHRFCNHRRRLLHAGGQHHR